MNPIDMKVDTENKAKLSQQSLNKNVIYSEVKIYSENEDISEHNKHLWVSINHLLCWIKGWRSDMNKNNQRKNKNVKCSYIRYVNIRLFPI
jgi:hypothetical protein